jgi:hypothetical protein
LALRVVDVVDGELVALGVAEPVVRGGVRSVSLVQPDISSATVIASATR